MRFSLLKQTKKTSDWHPWFAWKPVRIQLGEKSSFAWLEIVLRRQTPVQRAQYSWTKTEYKLW